MRRAVARAAVSASRVTSNKQSMLRVATQVAVGRAAAPAAVRFFSQTLRVANEDAFNTLQSEATNTEGEPILRCSYWLCQAIHVLLRRTLRVEISERALT